MKFKVLKETVLFDKIVALLKRRTEANKAALDYAKELGAENVTIGNMCIGGGITSFQFKTEPDRILWRENKRFSGFWIPKGHIKFGKDIFRKISELPTVTWGDANEIFGSDDFLSSPGIEILHNCALVEISAFDKPSEMPEGLLPIKDSEWYLLLENKTKKP